MFGWDNPYLSGKGVKAKISQWLGIPAALKSASTAKANCAEIFKD